MKAVNLKIITLIGMWILGTGCSSTETLREKYISADIRKAEMLSKKAKRLNRKISSSSSDIGHGILTL